MVSYRAECKQPGFRLGNGRACGSMLQRCWRALSTATHVAAQLDRPDDSARAEQRHHVRDDVPALVSAATSGARAVVRPL